MTMFNSKLVASIKANGKILREFKDTVYIPFGTEYSILLKNLNTVRAIVNIYIDGENVTPNGLVINAGQQVDFERSLANGSLTGGNKFKFIERTGKIEDHRGVKLEDGLIRVEYQFEKVYPKNPVMTWNNGYNTLHDSWTSTLLRGSAADVTPSYMKGTVSCADMAVGATSINNMAVGATLSASAATHSFNAAPQTETGITVAGSKSEQKFVTVSNFATETEKHSIVIKLLGETEDNKAIREPITVKTKPKCTTCGKQNKATAKFCSECGTALVIYA